MNDFLAPFFKAKLVPLDLNQLDSLKSTMKTMSYTEQCLKAKLNKYGEKEIFFSGKVQFDKIVNDLEYNKYKLKIENAKKEFKEQDSLCKGAYIRDENVEFIIKFGVAKNFNEEEFKSHPIDIKVLKSEQIPNKNLIVNEKNCFHFKEFVKIEHSNGNIFYIKSDFIAYY